MKNIHAIKIRLIDLTTISIFILVIIVKKKHYFPGLLTFDYTKIDRYFCYFAVPISSYSSYFLISTMNRTCPDRFSALRFSSCVVGRQISIIMIFMFHYFFFRISHYFAMSRVVVLFASAFKLSSSRRHYNTCGH